MKRLAVATVIAVVLAACNTAVPFGDTHRVWCGAHPAAVVQAGDTLGLSPSRFVKYKAEVEQASLDGDSDRATSLILSWVGEQITATDTDPHPDLDAMPSWEADAAADYQRACTAAYDAK